ncbi:hypothetical protein [Flavobacterium sp. '19STA2R22 D10 B1']|uniref:hypothetical protein n=1 Tax=Flavobacterium aerium TaxID=3037261 RepID=UPI00278BBBBF|nr:hypothetical protein [Flavobacterium sp. '19STA2R22 D10 B1']
MNSTRIYVDFNELIDMDIVLLSQEDTKLDAEGNSILLYEGKPINIYQDNTEDDMVNNLVASGVVEKNNSGVFPISKWVCRINEKGIHLESEL